MIKHQTALSLSFSAYYGSFLSWNLSSGVGNFQKDPGSGSFYPDKTCSQEAISSKKLITP